MTSAFERLELLLGPAALPRLARARVVEPEQVGPEAGEDLLGGGGGRDERLARIPRIEGLPLRAGEPAPIHLAVRSERQRVERGEGGGGAGKSLNT